MYWLEIKIQKIDSDDAILHNKSRFSNKKLLINKLKKIIELIKIVDN